MSRASTPETTGIGCVRVVQNAPTHGVALSMAGVDNLSDAPPLIGTRGSFADAKGRALLILPFRSKLSPTTYRRAPRRVQRPVLLVVGCEYVSRMKPSAHARWYEGRGRRIAEVNQRLRFAMSVAV